MRVVLPFKLIGQKLVKGRDFPKSIADGSKNTIVARVDGLPENVITKAYFKLSWESNTIYDLTFNGSEVVLDEYIVDLPHHANNKYVEYKISMSIAIFDGGEERLTTDPVELVLNKSNYSDETTNTPKIPQSQYEQFVSDVNKAAKRAEDAADRAESAAGGGEGGDTIVVDDKLDQNSTNPVQNKVITGVFYDIENALDSSIAILENLLPPFPITFYFAGNEYQALSGMTWLEFVNSEYNTRGFVCSGEDGYVYPNTGSSYGLKLNEYTFVFGADKIVPDATYILGEVNV